jgi:peptide/nickel transport system permease protein
MRAFVLRLGISGTMGLVLTILWLLIALFGPFIAPHGPGEVVDYDVFLPMSAEHPLGTDYLGRSVLSRVMDGARFTVGIAFIAALLAVVMGTSLGLLAAVSRKMIDEAISRFMDTLLSIPNKIFALVTIATFGSSTPILLLVAGVTYTPGIFRIARALAVNINQMDYIEVARARGEGRLYLALFEVLPNMLYPILTDFGLRFVYIVLLLSSLSFLGLGVQPPNADLGSLVRENMSGLWEGAPAILAPSIAIASLTIGVNLFIDSLREKV